MLHCCQCSGPAHLACLHKQFKDAGNVPLKNKMEWLYEFIRSVSLFYRCKFCSSVSKPTFNGFTNQTTDAQITSLSNSMMQLSN